jgi:aminoglycoside phosphotransferase (APT) family kinase protein
VAEPDPALVRFALSSGLAAPGKAMCWTALAGGVSSDIWRLDLPGRSLCLKRALPRLKVAAEWVVPVARNASEWDFLSVVSALCPGRVPTPLATDPELGVFAMAFLDPATHPVWKSELLAGRVVPEFAGRVGVLLGTIHRATARDAALAARFATDDLFHAIRVEPYLLASAARHPALAARLHALAEVTQATRLALVHGDVSPKNILVGPDGPVLLDAECAWFGDPAFDVAFCLTHLLLKRLARPDAVGALEASFAALVAGYLPFVTWEDSAALEARAAALLPALLLARIDGKSPVEYLDPTQQDLVRQTAGRLLVEPVSRLDHDGFR